MGSLVGLLGPEGCSGGLLTLGVALGPEGCVAGSAGVRGMLWEGASRGAQGGCRGGLKMGAPHLLPTQTHPLLCPHRFRSIHCHLYPDTPWCPHTAVF